MTLSSPPKVLIDSFMKVKDKICIDPISKIYVITEAIFGLNRLALLEEHYLYPRIRIFVMLYCFILNVIVIISVSYQYVTDTDGIFIFVNEFSYIVCCLLSYQSATKLRSYFRELNRFDRNVGSTFRFVHFLYQNIVLNTAILILSICISIGHVSGISGTQMNNRWHFIPVRWLHVLEVYFFGYLFHSIVSRIMLVNYFMGSCSSSTQFQNTSVRRFGDFDISLRSEVDYSEMKFLMELYETLIAAHRDLINAINWQERCGTVRHHVLRLSLFHSKTRVNSCDVTTPSRTSPLLQELDIQYLSILTTSFLTSLGVANRAVSLLLQKPEEALSLDLWKIISYLSFTFGYTLVQFLSCIHQHQITSEVRRLRMLIAWRLYENNLDKPSRGVARALLLLTEQRDFSFSLFGMFTVDTSLPLKYSSLFVSYLIIMLQFEKVLGFGD